MSEVKHSIEKLHVKQWKISVSFFCFVLLYGLSPKSNTGTCILQIKNKAVPGHCCQPGDKTAKPLRDNYYFVTSWLQVRFQAAWALAA